MKIAFCLSGSIRDHEQSVGSLGRLSHHQVDTYIHTWSNIDGIHPNHWMDKRAFEPHSHIIDKYNPVGIVVEEWPLVKPALQWRASNKDINLWGMYYSMSRCYELVEPKLEQYDLVIRMRFDTMLYGDLFELGEFNGWTIPNGADFTGINDRLGWLYNNHTDEVANKKWVGAYLNTYEALTQFIQESIEYCPEVFLLTNLTRNSTPIRRVEFNYSILGF